MFSKEQILEIKTKLALYGVKDSSLPKAKLPLVNTEEIAFIQNGKNVRMKLQEIVEYLQFQAISEIINVSERVGESALTLEEAILLIEEEEKALGLTITFLDSTTYSWVIYQYKGVDLTGWANPDLWNKLFSVLTPTPDVYNLTSKAPLPEGNYYQITNNLNPYFAPSYIPTILRKRGLIITIEVEGENWASYQFCGTSLLNFSSLSNWKKISPYSAADLEDILTGGKLDKVIMLLQVSEDAPDTCNVGERYYNTVDNAIYTCEEENQWPLVGKKPEQGKIYGSLEDSMLWFTKDGIQLSAFYATINGGEF